MTIDNDILIKYIDNILSDAERVQVETWLDASIENKKTLEQLYFTLQLTERLRVMKSVNTEKAFAQFKAKRDKQKGKVSFGVSWLSLQRIAAILLIPLLVLSGYLLLRNSADRLQMVEISTNPGIISTFDLPDGSKVWLNSGSSLKYADKFDSNKRLVELNGEAYFEVTKNAKKPFVVKVTDEYSVQVLGTSFNVLAYPEEDVIATTLVEGSVQIEFIGDNGENKLRVLSPNEKAEYQKGNKQMEVKSMNNTDASTGWTKGEIVFKQETMENVLRELSRHYNVRFDIKNPEVLKAVITARFKDEQLPQVMEYLKVASGIKYVIHKPTVSSENEMMISVVEISK